MERPGQTPHAAARVVPADAPEADPVGEKVRRQPGDQANLEKRADRGVQCKRRAENWSAEMLRPESGKRKAEDRRQETESSNCQLRRTDRQHEVTERQVENGVRHCQDLSVAKATQDFGSASQEQDRSR